MNKYMMKSMMVACVAVFAFASRSQAASVNVSVSCAGVSVSVSDSHCHAVNHCVQNRCYREEMARREAAKSGKKKTA